MEGGEAFLGTVVKREVVEDEEAEEAGGVVVIMDPNECLVCLRTTSGEVQQTWKDPHHQQTPPPPPGEPPLLTSNVRVIFLLRHLLQYPQEECSSLLSSTGLDPGRWCVLCQQCSSLVRDAFQLHLEVAKLNRQIQGIGTQLKTEMKSSSFPPTTTSSGGGGGQEEDGEWNAPPSWDCWETLNVQWSIRNYFTGKAGGGGRPLVDPIKGFPQKYDNSNSLEEEDYLEIGATAENYDDDPPSFGSDSDPDFNLVDLERNNNNNGKGKRKKKLISKTSSLRKRQTRQTPPSTSSTSLEMMTPAEVAVAVVAPSTGSTPKRTTRRVGTATKLKSSATNSSPSSSKKEATKQRRRRGLEYTCRNCKATFTSSIKYYEHRRTSHRTDLQLDIPTVHSGTLQNRKSRICKICNTVVKGRLGLTAYVDHMLSHETDEKSGGGEGGGGSTTHSCTQCHKSFRLKLNLELHQTIFHSPASFVLKCEICGAYKHDTREDLIAHLKTHSDSESVYSCKQCPMSVTSMNSMLKHMLRHVGSKRLECPLCDDPSFTCGTHKELVKHCQKCHPERAQTFSCPMCDKSFIVAYKLRYHMLAAHGSITQPSGEVVVDQEDDAMIIVCHHCGKTYKNQAKLENHIRNMHSENKPHKCEQCERSFLYPSDLRSHIEEKHEKVRFACDLCPKSFSCRTTLNVHTRIHTGEDLRTCHSCGMQFPTTSQLNSHIRNNHESEVVSKESARVCQLCGKTVKNEQRLKAHMNAVHKERRHECDHCGLKFARKDNLRSHLRTHTGERPFPCPDCGKAFNRKDIMLVHLKGHHHHRHQDGGSHSRGFLKSEESQEFGQ